MERLFFLRVQRSFFCIYCCWSLPHRCWPCNSWNRQVPCDWAEWGLSFWLRILLPLKPAIGRVNGVVSATTFCLFTVLNTSGWNVKCKQSGLHFLKLLGRVAVPTYHSNGWPWNVIVTVSYVWSWCFLPSLYLQNSESCCFVCIECPCSWPLSYDLVRFFSNC